MEKIVALNNGEDIAALLNPGTFALSPQAAAAELARMTVEYNQAPPTVAEPGPKPEDRTRAAEARVKLEALKADPEWGKRYLAGDVATRKTFDELTEAIAAGGGGDADLALIGHHPDGHIDSGNGATLRDMISAVPELREAGVPDDVIKQVLEDRPVSRTERAMTEQLLRERMGNAEWRQKLMSGDFAVKRENLLMSVILASRVDGE
jgi:hypothetical protein